MTAGTEAKRIANDVMADFRRMFPGSKILPAERQYLVSMIMTYVHEAMAWDEDDHR